MKFTSGALTARLPTGPLHGDEAAAEEGLFMKDLGKAGSSPTFRIGQVASRAHLGSPPFELSDILIYIRTKRLVKQFFKCEFAPGRSCGLKLWNPWRVRKEKNRFTEFLGGWVMPQLWGTERGESDRNTSETLIKRTIIITPRAGAAIAFIAPCSEHLDAMADDQQSKDSAIRVSPASLSDSIESAGDSEGLRGRIFFS